ncbi:hypothetical protein AVEN_42763-1 [Araneus ventricosus]|uniref:Uncharacterized protein n=1 Tax=Araneus ventricosus TaxID=182803 RepID=A0A4Y2AE94_ARAVE|nr:hypothetical protein AVEN_42763-1 [Araneus ventricosus]
MLNNQSFSNSHETNNIIGDEVGTVEIIQEDTSALQALYLENQQDAFDEFAKPNFPITRLPSNAYCREWPLKHGECCLKGSMLEHSDKNRDLQNSNECDIRRVSETTGQRIFDSSQE